MKPTYLGLLSGILFFAGPMVGAAVPGNEHAVSHSPATENGKAVSATRPLNTTTMAAAVAAAKGDALLDALLTELSRSYTHLKMDQVQAPYYIEYRVNDVDDFAAGGA